MAEFSADLIVNFFDLFICITRHIIIVIDMYKINVFWFVSLPSEVKITLETGNPGLTLLSKDSC